MKIEYRKGNLLNTDSHYIIHGCNAQGVMNSGVAKAIRERWPKVYEDYKAWYDNCTDKFLDSLPLGHYHFVKVEDHTIINAVTQKYYGRDGTRYVSYDAIDEIFEALDDKLDFGSKIAMPKIGAGLGGGSWEVISSIIEHRCHNVSPIVYEL